MSSRRVVVTGFGVVSALGHNAQEHLEGLREGRSGIGPLTGIEGIEGGELSISIAAQVRDFKLSKNGTEIRESLLDRFSQFALEAGAEAVKSSGIEFDEKLARRTATVVGSSQGGANTLEENYRLVYGDRGRRVPPLTIPRSMSNAAASLLSMAHGLQGPAWNVSTACASSNHTIGQAFHLIRAGGADAALAGGAEAGLTYGTLKAWESLRVMSRDACRPFSANRSGLVQGEGAAILVLEELERAKKRGAEILCELVGFGMTADAADIVQPSIEGGAHAMATALADGGFPPEAVDYINAHGTATAANDRNECAGIRKVFGAHADRLLVSSTKSMHGHPIGAAGAIEMAAVILALREGIVAPTIGYEEPDPECDLDVVPNEAREARVKVAISNNFAFGGMNAVLLVRRFDG